MKTSARSPRPDSPNTTKFTYSQALAAGLSHSGWLTGPTNDPCGRDRALASHSVPPATARALTMRDTCGLLFAGYSPSADLQRSLASRLRLRLDANGSLEYSLTWKRWDIGQREPICALRALARRTSGKDCGGWRSPTGSGGEGGEMDIMRAKREGLSPMLKLRDQAGLAGWPTASRKTVPPSGIHAGMTLTDAASIAGWQTPKLPSGGPCQRNTPGGGLRKLEDQADLAGWPTASSRDWKDTPGMSERGVNPDGSERKRLDQLPRVAGLASGATTPSSDAKTESCAEYRLNPAFSGWLMGYPLFWTMIGFRAILKMKGQYDDYRKALLQSLEGC